jgi:TonB family protein
MRLLDRHHKRGFAWIPVLIVAAIVILVVMAVLWYLHRHPHFFGVHHRNPAAHAWDKNKPASPSKKAHGDPYEIEGPAKERTLLHRVLPQYPDWAEEQGLQGAVELSFQVLEDGSVGPNITVIHTSMSTALDTLCQDALHQWKFSSGPVAKEESIIRFHFSLHDSAPR